MNLRAIVKPLVIFVGGAAIGGGTAWLITKKHYEAVIDERVEEIVAPALASYQNRESEEDNISEDKGKITFLAVEDLDEEEEPSKEWGEESYTTRMNRIKEERMQAASDPRRVRYDLMSKKEDIPEEEVDEVLLAKNDDDPSEDIYVITKDQFLRERMGYDKVTLYWWELERILSEEDFDILDVPDLLGNRWEQHIGEEEKDVVYVRNNELETDYEVVVQHDSFYEMRPD